MSYGPLSVFSDSIASGASTSGGINLQQGWKQIYVQVGTMSTSAALTVQNSVDSGTTWYNVYQPPINSATVAVNQLTIGSAVGTNGGVVPLPTGGLKQVRFLTTGVVSGGVAFKLICSN